jgi:shikimate kinase
MSNLYFTGLRGSGKTTVSRIVAEDLFRECISTDEMVEAKCRKSIADIVRTDGVDEFRRREVAAVRDVVSQQDLVVDLGGGAILDPASRMLIRNSGVVVFLKCALPVLWHRIKMDPQSPRTRPGLSAISGLDELHQMFRDRIAIYTTCADYTIDTTAMRPEEVAHAVVHWFRSDDNTGTDGEDDAADNGEEP